MADNRVPRFELHIKPLIRLLDRDKMLGWFDLYSYEQVVLNAKGIRQVLKGHAMPPPAWGGPWPQEWIDLFGRWVDAGFPRLELASVAAGAGYSAARSGSQISITARGRVPVEGYRVWLDLTSVSPDHRAYNLVQEPPIPVPVGPDRTFVARDQFDAAASDVTVTVVDANGSHVVPVAAASFLNVPGAPTMIREQIAIQGWIVSRKGHVDGLEQFRLGEHVLEVEYDAAFTQINGNVEALAIFRSQDKFSKIL